MYDISQILQDFIEFCHGCEMKQLQMKFSLLNVAAVVSLNWVAFVGPTVFLLPQLPVHIANGEAPASYRSSLASAVG